MNYLTAIVPVRQNSQRVKKKNFRKFNKKNLLIYKLEKLKKIKAFDEIIVNTDSDDAIKIAKSLNLSFYKREKYFASSKCPNYKFWRNVAQNTNSEYIFFTNCTSPMIKISTYQKTIDRFEKNKKKYDSLNTVNLVKDFLFFKGKSINFNQNKSPNSQDLPEIYRLNFAINIIAREKMKFRKSLLGKKPLFYLLDEVEGFDIDTNYQFEYAQFLHKRFFNN